jgi:hypothetical protein
MKKILIALALLALSIQTSYATIAGYCQEEQGSAMHVAHHEHKEAAATFSANDFVAADSDCGVCHLAHSPALKSSFSVSIAATTFHYESAQVEFLVDFSPAPPEKPNWISLA